MASALSLAHNYRNNLNKFLFRNLNFTADVGFAIFQLRGQKRKYSMAQILIADDDALIVEVVFHKLQESGHIVAVVDSGMQALEIIRLEEPDIVILDNLMPGLKGIEILTQLKNHAITASIHVIMLTAQTGRNHMVKAYDAGATDYMTKPFHPESLVARITAMVQSIDSHSPQTGQSI